MVGESPRLLTATAVRGLARRHHIKPSKALGQNFVIDPNTIRRIVRLA
ncbi:MAG: 16S rRNA (adenine(1518)-N(6)/adenine(1519)-N(6))-dimethyltransferase RsmA, partial [Actinomycetota bacterium]